MGDTQGGRLDGGFRRGLASGGSVLRATPGLAFAAVVAAQVLAGCVTTGDVPDDRFVRFFDELAFGSVVDGSKRDRLARREEPLEYSVVGDNAFSDAAATAMAATARFAGIETDPQRLSVGGIGIRQEPPGSTFPVNRDQTDCAAHYRRKDDRIVNAEIRIAASDPERLQLCLYHEIFHVLGLGHSGTIASVMSPFHKVGYPTRWDVMAVRFLMSEAVSPGMTRAQVLAVLRRELPALRAAVDGRHSSRAGTEEENKT